MRVTFDLLAVFGAVFLTLVLAGMKPAMARAEAASAGIVLDNQIGLTAFCHSEPDMGD